MNRQEKAVAYFDSMNCNQAVLTVFGSELGLNEKQCSENLFNTVCPGLVKSSVSILESILK